MSYHAKDGQHQEPGKLQVIVFGCKLHDFMALLIVCNMVLDLCSNVKRASQLHMRFPSAASNRYGKPVFEDYLFLALPHAIQSNSRYVSMPEAR